MKKIITFILIVFNAANLAAQQPTGLPFITNYSPLKTHYYGPSTWILQGNDGVMYFGTWDTKINIEEYDGVSWTEALQNQNIHGHTRAAAKDSSGTIFYGGSGDFGYLSRDSASNTICVSLLQYVPEDKRHFPDDIYTVTVDGNNVYFQSGTRLFRLTKTGSGKNIKWTCKTWDGPKTYFNSFFNIGHTLFLQEWGKGLFKLTNDSLQLITNDSAVSRSVVMAMLPNNDSTGRKGYLIVTYDRGLFLLNGSHISPFHTEADKILKSNRLLTAIMLNGNYAIGTLGAGIIIINPQGKILQVINRKSGMPNNNVMVLHWDGYHNLWAATDKSICRLDMNSPFSRFSDESGIPSVIGSVGYLPDGSFYVGGVGVMKYKTATHQFENIPSLSDDGGVIMLRDGDQLILGGSSGQYALKGDNSMKITKGGVKTDAMLISKKYPNLLCAGTTQGLFIFIKDKTHHSTGGWKGLGFVRETAGEVIHWIAEQPDGRLWITNDLGNRLSRITLSVDKSGIPDLSKTKVEEFSSGKAFSDNMYAVGFKDKTFYFGDSSVYALNEAAKQFEKDTVLLSSGDTLNGYKLGVNGIVWLNSEKGKYDYLTSTETGEKYRVDSSAWTLLRNNGLQQSFPGDDGIIWGTALDGLVRYDTKIPFHNNSSFNVLIRKVTVEKQALNTFLSGKNIPKIKYGHQTISFDYAAPFFTDEGETQYQTRLQGFDTAWSDWSRNAYKEFTNLPHGQYVFQVRARNVYGNISSEANYAFHILPAWWQTWWAYLVYALLLIAWVWGFVNYRSRNLKRKNQELEKKVSERTNELSQSLENLKSTQKQLIQSEKMASLGELTAGIAHEIQNPLNFVNNFSDINQELIGELQEDLKSGNVDDAVDLSNDIKANSEKINHHGKRADAIVKGMLQHSRSSSGVKEPTDINALCDEYLRLSYHGLRAKDKSFNATMETKFDENIGKINVVPQDIGRVLLNIINNAFFAVNERAKIRPGGQALQGFQNLEGLQQGYAPTVTLVTHKDEKCVTISVRDNGNGIPEKIKDKIFQPFFTTKPTGSGTGLGLSLAYDIIKAHGGEMKVNSKEGEFTEFIIQLPA